MELISIKGRKMELEGKINARFRQCCNSPKNKPSNRI